MAWPLSNTHTVTLIHTISNTQTRPGNRPRFVQMGYYSDVQLYSKGSSTVTALSGQLKATTSLCLENNQDSVTTDDTKWKVLLDTLSISEGFSLFYIHGSSCILPKRDHWLLYPFRGGLILTKHRPEHTPMKWDPITKEPVVNWPFVKSHPP